MSLSDEILKSIQTHRESVLASEYSSKELLSMFEIGAKTKPQSSKTKPVSKSAFKVGDFVWNGHRFAQIRDFDSRGFLKVERYYEHDGSHARFTYNAEDCQLIKPAEDYVRDYLNGKDLTDLEKQWIDTWLATQLKPHLHSVDVFGYYDVKERNRPSNGTLEKTLKVSIDYMNNPRAIMINYTISYTCGITVIIAIALRKTVSKYNKVFTTTTETNNRFCPPFVNEGYLAVDETYDGVVFNEETLRPLIDNDIDVAKLTKFQESLKTRKPKVKKKAEPMITWDTLKPSDFKRHKDFKDNGLYFAKIEGGNYYIFRDTGGIRAWYVQRSLNGSDDRFSMATTKKDAVADLKKKFGTPQVSEPVQEPQMTLEQAIEFAKNKAISNVANEINTPPANQSDLRNIISQFPNNALDILDAYTKVYVKAYKKKTDDVLQQLMNAETEPQTTVKEKKPKAKSKQTVTTIQEVKSYPNGTIFVAVNENELEGAIVAKVGSELFIFDEYGGAFTQNVNQNTIDELGGTLRVAHQVSEDDLNEAYFDEDLALEIIEKAK